jgi:hypothetical protein
MYFNRVDFKGIDIACGELEHREPLLRACTKRSSLPGLACGDELYLVQLERGEGCVRQRQVRIVNGVEASAKKSDAH